MSDKSLQARAILWANLMRLRTKSSEVEKLKFLKSIALFQDLSFRQIRDLSNIIYERTYNKNEHIFEIQQPGAALFIIQSGQVSIELPPSSLTDGTPEAVEPSQRAAAQLALLGPGAFFGDLALLDQTPRSASARANLKTQCLVLFREDLNKLIDSKPKIACLIYRSLATVIGERLKATNSLISEDAPKNEAPRLTAA